MNRRFTHVSEETADVGDRIDQGNRAHWEKKSDPASLGTTPAILGAAPGTRAGAAQAACFKFGDRSLPHSEGVSGCRPASGAKGSKESWGH